MCGLGQTAANPVLSTLRYFRDEYEAHIEEKRCPAGVCKSLIRYVVIPEKCTGCLACKKACPQDAIRGVLKGVHIIDQEKCIKCGACLEACRFEAVETQRDEAIAIVKEHMITFKLNKLEVQAEEGLDLLETAKFYGLEIPHLCHKRG